MAAKDKITDRIPEWKLQAAACADLDRRIADGAPFLFAGSLEGVKLNPYVAMMAKATGMKAGEPDLRLYFAHGRTVFAELKGENGKLNTDQKARIPILRALGFTVHVVFAASEDEMVARIAAIVERELQWPGGSAGMDSATWWPKVRGK